MKRAEKECRKTMSVNYTQAVRTLINGMARSFDVFGSFHETANRRSCSNLSDYERMRKDWENIGKDMRKAISSYGG